MKITFIGYGNVGLPLASQLQKLGHEVTLAARDASSESVQKALALNANLNVDSPAEAVNQAEVVFLATPFSANQKIIEGLVPQLEGKILVDCTNPVGRGFTHGLNNEQSGSEWIQSLIPKSHVVKHLVSMVMKISKIINIPNTISNQPCSFVVITTMQNLQWSTYSRFGLGTMDVGGLEQALHLEHMTLMWVRLVRKNRHSPQLVWGAFRRSAQ